MTDLYRPLVRSTGVTQQLPSGAAVAGLPLYAPAYQADGTLLKLALSTSYALTATQSDGTALSIPMVLNG